MPQILIMVKYVLLVNHLKKIEIKVIVMVISLSKFNDVEGQVDYI